MPGWGTRSGTCHAMPGSAWAACIGCTSDLRPLFGRVCNCVRIHMEFVVCYLGPYAAISCCLCACAAIWHRTGRTVSIGSQSFSVQRCSLILLLFSGDNALLIARLALQLFDIVAIEGNNGVSLPLCEHFNVSKSTLLLLFTIIREM